MKTRLHYIDMRPAPVEPEPSTLAIWAGAAAMLAIVYAVTFIVFTF